MKYEQLVLKSYPSMLAIKVNYFSLFYE